MPDPLTIALALRGIQLGANLGADFLGRNDVKKAQARQDKDISRVNLINAFGGNAQASPVSVTSGGGTNFLRGLGRAAGVGSQVAGLAQGFKTAGLQNKILENKVAEIDRANQMRQGAAEGLASAQTPQLPSVTATRPLQGFPNGGDRMAPGKFTLGGSVSLPPSPDLNTLGRASFNVSKQGEQARQLGVRQAAEDRARKIGQENFDNAVTLRELQQKDATEAGRNARAESELQFKLDKLRSDIDIAKGLNPTQRAGIEGGLRKEFTAVTKDFRTIGSAFEKILSGAENPSAASDLSLIFNFMKMLDPGSVVRESEFKNAESSGSFSEGVQNTLSKFWDGERLTTTRADFLGQAMKIYESQLPQYKTVVSDFTGIADRNQVNSANVVLTQGVNLDKAKKLLSSVKAITNSNPSKEDRLRGLPGF